MVQEMKREANTGTSNEQYDLIGLIYHSLKSAAACETYCQDAERAGDNELCDFFRQAKERSTQQAEQAKQFLAQRMR